MWVAERLPGYTAESLKPCTTMGITRNSHMIAGAVFNNYRPP
jgi:hypothetical protein